MFVQNLTATQQALLLDSAKEIMLADGISQDEELSMLDLLKSQCIDGVIAQKYELNEFSSLFTTEKEKCSFLFELLGIALADNEFHASEDELLKQYAQALNISNEKLMKLKQWVEAQVALFNQAEELMK